MRTECTRKPTVFTLAAIFLALVCLSSTESFADDVPFDDPRWRFDADTAETVEFRGQRALLLRDGRAWLPDVQVTDGVIEFDIAFGPERGFSGAMFRLRERGDFENFYFRPHQSGKPDASQYTPEIAGVSGWQLYHGPAFSPPFVYRFDEWMHVEIAFSGDRATVSLDGEIHLVPHLKRPVEAGAIGLRSGYAPAYFADFRYRHGVPEDFPAAAPPETEPLEVAGLVRSWRVSEAFSPDQRPAVRLGDEKRDRLGWTTRRVEPEGFVNLARSDGVDDENRSVLAELEMDAERRGHRLLRFGYSDTVRVFLGDREVYRGDNSYRSRDYRYLGTIGLFDALVVPVEPGRNRVTFAVSESFGGWGVMAAVSPLPTTACTRVEGFAELSSAPVILLGELHGTDRSPAAFAALVCQVAREHGGAVVGLEIHHTEQPRLDAFLASEGTPEDRDRLLTGPFWIDPYQDGRRSRAMVALLEALRDLSANGFDLEVVAFDPLPDVDPGDREEGMARRLAAARSEHPDRPLLALVGNLHPRTVRGSSWDADFLPMGARLRAAGVDVLSLDIRHAGGSAWMCTGASVTDCGRRAIRGSGSPRTQPRLELFAEAEPETGYAGVLWIGEVEASPPAARGESSTAAATDPTP